MIKLKNVKFHYQTMPMAFDLHILPQEKVAIIGESGAGKSTLLNLIAGFDYANSGEIWLKGENHTQTAPHQRPVSMLFQENNLFTHLTVVENIALGLKPNLSLSKEEKMQVEQAASAVNLQAFLRRKPTALSGGQKQRVALARCLLRDKPILLLDEPFSALDPQLRGEMLGLIDRLCVEKKLTLLLVTHQPQELEEHIDRVISIHQGRNLEEKYDNETDYSIK
ncbi:thiamine ABC transporter ATP-binding protein [Rodentibacter myodis]|uniref:Thiamine ABC transporter, ATP-binding protein n=1 Tax=Rodentibacter myodis TaxID=1907939 RepID=A0A1V3JT00_9PAST|nr:thiamine ABC transporter ATP-binding protein [Rodentibacter myodis]OOF59847.1 thiamine ABC transporter, ATP-binding protein [Rodentibacter myodis]